MKTNTLAFFTFFFTPPL
ncbi:pheA operon attenuation leader peptide PheL [Shewanella oneidensis MR-1]|uniref:PheA operon attenuation leader peptide PheL n=1 Tax=Shewanella oneidensis (strain ATCC 700550 / JCM 31522 / CIP 106686 / LMG 19005 / NCIMB 14063 / MR-1) TaxID=211586 RepID=K4PSE5_SHEON|nr:pheA operon attenuation leader peptide PheL [Shewanella oneidensis MR-1]